MYALDGTRLARVNPDGSAVVYLEGQEVTSRLNEELLRIKLSRRWREGLFHLGSILGTSENTHDLTGFGRNDRKPQEDQLKLQRYSAADRFDVGGDQEALTEDAQRGLTLFRGKARCTRCHSGFNFTDEKFHNLGIGWDDNTVDLGRYMVTQNPEELGAFKTPTLREIARSAPYMHDGRFKTLKEVVDFYNKGGVKNPHQDNLIIPLELTDQEKHDLLEFLQTLNGEGWQHVSAPKSFPK